MKAFGVSRFQVSSFRFQVVQRYCRRQCLIGRIRARWEHCEGTMLLYVVPVVVYFFHVSGFKFQVSGCSAVLPQAMFDRSRSRLGGAL